MNVALPTTAAVPSSSTPRLLLRLEGALGLVASAVAFRLFGGHWALFALLFLAPALAMVGYRFGTRTGARCYNAVHTYIAPAALAAVGMLFCLPVLYPVAAVWSAHIGFDRVLGYGLKYETAFEDTHLGKV